MTQTTIRSWLTALALTAAAFSSCPAAGIDNETPERPVLKVTGDNNYPPYSYLDDGIPAGFDIDIIRALSDTLNLNIEISLQPWAATREAFQRIDFPDSSGWQSV